MNGDDELDLRRTFLDIALTLSRQFLAGLLQLGIVLMVSRVLGAEGAGIYALALLLPMLMSSLLNLGLASSNVYHIASRQFDVHSVWAVSRNLAIVVGALGFGAGIAFLFFFGESVFPGIPLKYLFLSMMIFPLSLLIGMISSIFQGLQDFRSLNALVLLQPFAASIGIGCLWTFDALTMASALSMVVASYAVSLAIGLMFLAWQIPLAARCDRNVGYLSSAIRYGYKAHLGNLFSMLIYRSDLLLVNLFLGPTFAGIYVIGVRFVEQLSMISTAVSTVILPRMSSMVGNESGRRATTPLISRIVTWSTALAALTLAVIALPVINILLGVEFEEAASIVWILLPGIVCLAASRVLANDLAARGLVHINLFFALAMLLANILGNVLLIPLFGIIGAALATSVVYGMNLMVRLYVQQRITQVLWWQNIVPTRDDFRRLARFMNGWRTTA